MIDASGRHTTRQRPINARCRLSNYAGFLMASGKIFDFIGTNAM